MSDATGEQDEPGAAGLRADGPAVEVRRSRRRRRTVSARRDGETVLVLIPATMTVAEEELWVPRMVQRVLRAEERRRTPPGDEDLMAWATRLSDRYLGGLAQPESVRWVENQQSRWGSCTPGDRSIRLSTRLQQMPRWVVEYVLVHELAHLLEPGHDAKFWAWVRHYPQTVRAQGYLLGWSAAHQMDPPLGETEPVPE